jgi:hypothetical protein
LADFFAAFFAASRFSAFFVTFSARDGLCPFASVGFSAFGSLATFGFGAFGGLATFTGRAALTFGCPIFAWRSARASLSRRRSSSSACSSSDGGWSAPCECTRLIIAR